MTEYQTKQKIILFSYTYRTEVLQEQLKLEKNNLLRYYFY